MSADAVVEDLDVFEEALAGLGSGLVVLVVDEFFLQGGEEGLVRHAYQPVPLPPLLRNEAPAPGFETPQPASRDPRTSTEAVD